MRRHLMGQQQHVGSTEQVILETGLKRDSTKSSYSPGTLTPIDQFLGDESLPGNETLTSMTHEKNPESQGTTTSPESEPNGHTNELNEQATWIDQPNQTSLLLAQVHSALCLSDIRNTECVSRWHMVRMHRPQSLAEHSYRVALYAARMATGLHGTAVLASHEWAQLYMWALLHDAEELDYGDTPTVTKKKFVCPDFQYEFWGERGSPAPDRFISPDVKALVKVADILEAVLHYEEYGYDDTNHGLPIKLQLMQSLENYAMKLEIKGQLIWPTVQAILSESGIW